MGVALTTILVLLIKKGYHYQPHFTSNPILVTIGSHFICQDSFQIKVMLMLFPLDFSFERSMFDSRQITVVSGRASDLECSCATLVCTVGRPILMVPKQINRTTSRLSHGITRYRDYISM